ncbi:MAG: AI-2E family transporter [Terriglobia bacterium]
MMDTNVETPSVTTASASLKIMAAVVVITCLYVASSILIPLVCSLFLAFILDPGVVLLERARLPRWLASLIMVLLSLGLVYLLGYLAYDRILAFISVLPRVAATIQQFVTHVQDAAAHALGQYTGPPASAPSLPAGPGLPMTDLPPWVQYLERGLGSVFGSVYAVAISVTFVPFLVFFMLTSKTQLLVATLNLFQVRRRHKAEVVIGGIGRMVRSYVLGNVLVALISAAVLTPVFAMVGLRFALILGPLAAFLTMIPYLGVLLSLGPPLLIAVIQFDRAGPFVAITIAVVGVHFLAMNVLTPKVVGRTVKLNALTVTIAMLFWGWLWGGIGLVLAVPITAAAKAVCDNITSLRPLGAWLGEG